MDLSIDKNMIDKDEYPATAEIESRCVHMLADLWNSPEAGQHDRLLDHRLQRGLHARRSGAEMEVARADARCRQADRQAEHRPGPVQVCWHKFARYFDVELREIPLERGPLGMTPGGSHEARRREHHRRRADVRRDVHLPIRAGGRGSRRARYACSATTALDIPMHVDAASGGFMAPFMRTRPDLGFPPSASAVDQCFGPQVRIGAARRGLGGVARQARPAGRIDLQCQLSGRQHADFRPEFLASRRPDHLPSTTCSSGSGARVTSAFCRTATTMPASRPGDLQARAVRACFRRR